MSVVTPHISRNPNLRFSLDLTQTRATGLMRSTHSFSCSITNSLCYTLMKIGPVSMGKIDVFFPYFGRICLPVHFALIFFCVQRMKLCVIVRASACEEKLDQFSNMADRNLMLLSWFTKSSCSKSNRLPIT